MTTVFTNTKQQKMLSALFSVMFSERSCDTEDSFAITGIHYILKYTKTEMSCFIL